MMNFILILFGASILLMIVAVAMDIYKHHIQKKLLKQKRNERKNKAA